VNDISGETGTRTSTEDKEAGSADRKPSPRPRPHPAEDDADDRRTDPDTDNADTDTADTDAGSTTEESTPPPRGTRAAATIVASVLVVVLLAVAGGVLWYVRAQHDHEQRDDAITVAAREAVLALLTLDPENVQGSLDRVLASSTGGWREQFAQQADQFTQIVRNGQVRATATITASAIQSADDNRATLLVLANSQIRNVESPQGYPGVYRVLLGLELQGDRWLVSDVQFVA
jgi:Mce-associated membrane protein